MSILAFSYGMAALQDLIKTTAGHRQVGGSLGAEAPGAVGDYSTAGTGGLPMLLLGRKWSIEQVPAHPCHTACFQSL